MNYTTSNSTQQGVLCKCLNRRSKKTTERSNLRWEYDSAGGPMGDGFTRREQRNTGDTDEGRATPAKRLNARHSHHFHQVPEGGGPFF